VPAGLDTEQAAWSLRLEEWAAAAAGPAAAAELRAALHAFAVTVALLSGAVTLLPSRQPKLCKTVERVLTQHLSTIKMELMGLKVTQQVSYAALHATVHATCAALLRFAPTLQEMSLSLARGSAASTTTTTTTTTTVAAAAAADGSGGDGGDYSDNGHVGVADGVAQGIGALDSPVAIHESLATLCGWLRQVVHSNLAPQLLGMADSAQERAAAALGALTAMLRMIEWAPPHAQTAVEALLEGWPAAVSYTGLAAGASAVSKRSLRTAAQAVLAAAVRALAGQADGSARSQVRQAQTLPEHQGAHTHPRTLDDKLGGRLWPAERCFVHIEYDAWFLSFDHHLALHPNAGHGGDAGAAAVAAVGCSRRHLPGGRYTAAGDAGATAGHCRRAHRRRWRGGTANVAAVEHAGAACGRGGRATCTAHHHPRPGVRALGAGLRARADVFGSHPRRCTPHALRVGARQGRWGW
jgi:hypothetical protein